MTPMRSTTTTTQQQPMLAPWALWKIHQYTFWTDWTSLLCFGNFRHTILHNTQGMLLALVQQSSSLNSASIAFLILLVQRTIVLQAASTDRWQRNLFLFVVRKWDINVCHSLSTCKTIFQSMAHSTYHTVHHEDKCAYQTGNSRKVVR